MGNQGFEGQTLTILEAIQNDVSATKQDMVALKKDVQVNCEKLDTIDNKIGELDRTLRGSNGDKGLIAEVAILQSRFESHVEVSGTTTKNGNGAKKNGDEGKITASWLLEKGLMPIIIAFLVWLFLDVVPNLITHLAGP
jgi:hypothetical protein